MYSPTLRTIAVSFLPLGQTGSKPERTIWRGGCCPGFSQTSIIGGEKKHKMEGPIGFLGLWAQVLPEKKCLARARAPSGASASAPGASSQVVACELCHERGGRHTCDRRLGRRRLAELFPAGGPSRAPEPGKVAELVKLQCLEKMSVYAVAAN